MLPLIEDQRSRRGYDMDFILYLLKKLLYLPLIMLLAFVLTIVTAWTVHSVFGKLVWYWVILLTILSALYFVLSMLIVGCLEDLFWQWRNPHLVKDRDDNTRRN